MNQIDTRVPVEVAEYYMREFVPSWHVCVEGPIPFGQTEPVIISVNDLLAPSADDAEAEVLAQARQLCEHWQREYDEDEWTVLHRQLRNGN